MSSAALAGSGSTAKQAPSTSFNPEVASSVLFTSCDRGDNTKYSKYTAGHGIKGNVAAFSEYTSGTAPARGNF
jgi:hypothetical protein